MPLVQKIFFYSISTIIFVLILELVRKKRLKENYSWLWLLISILLFLLINQYEFLTKIANLLQATPTAVLMFMGIIALLLLVLQLFLINSSQSVQIKNMAQKITLLEGRIANKS